LQQSDALQELLSAVVPAADGLPVFVKFSPDLEDKALDEAVEIAIETGCTGIIATNTSRTRPGTTGRLEAEGGMSGAPLWPLSRERIQRILDRSNGRIPVIGAGGIRSAEQAAELLDAGCVAVQVYSGMIFEGPGLPHRLNDGLDRRR
jgi:dihydroorotate dehydrogenase